MMNEYITPEEESEYLAYHDYNDVLNNFESGLQNLHEYDFSEYEGKTTLICGGMVAFDKGLTNFLNVMYSREKSLFLLSEVTAQYRRYTKQRVNMPFICTPHLLAKEMIVLSMNVETTKEMDELFQEKKYIRDAIDNIERRHIRLGKGYALAWAYYAHLYIYTLLKRLKPYKVILWNEFYAYHDIFKHVCVECGIPVMYMEFGCIPGTICIEEQGQQGESYPARHYKLFRSKRVSRKERLHSKKVIEYLKENGLNRNIQPNRKLSKDMLKFYKAGQKTISYFGQNDFESGVYPYTEMAAKYHSPIFRSSLEALEYLRLLAIRNNWNLVYKPHPIMNALGHELEIGTEIDKVTDIDINSVIDFSDLVVTILSQSAYIALIRGKPVLMLGYTQLKKKGCTYEAFVQDKIEGKIQLALKNGFTISQRKNFEKHVAQVLKYYLYDDGTHKEFPFGQRIH